ncbi:MAG: Uma2 family endonuclease [Bacteroidota bacterium]
MTKFPKSTIHYGSIDWTVDQYHNMVSAGILAENAPVELLYGKVIPKSPVGRFHAACVSNILEFFILNFGKAYTWRTQDPVAMLDHSEPEPDFVVAIRKEDNYASGHPTGPEVELLIEVSDTTLEKDRNHKKPIYALAGVKEYWIVNLVDRQLEVYTDLEEGQYQSNETHLEGEQVNHAVFGMIEVSELLPGLITKDY